MHTHNAGEDIDDEGGDHPEQAKSKKKRKNQIEKLLSRKNDTVFNEV